MPARSELSVEHLRGGTDLVAAIHAAVRRAIGHDILHFCARVLTSSQVTVQDSSAVLVDLWRRHGARDRTNEREHKLLPGSRSQPHSTFLVYPTQTSSGEYSRTKLQNVVADSTETSGGDQPELPWDP